MKITNKIICFLSVLVLCFPLFSPVQSVLAAELGDDGFLHPSYYGIEYFEPHEDGSGFVHLADDITSDGISRLRFKKCFKCSPYL